MGSLLVLGDIAFFIIESSWCHKCKYTTNSVGPAALIRASCHAPAVPIKKCLLHDKM